MKEIYPAFNKLTQNLIFVYKFKTNDYSFDSLRSDCVSFLFESLNKWSPERGTKAFSYFNVVAKNWLINNSQKNQKLSRRNISIDNSEDMSFTDKVYLEKHDIISSIDEIIIKRGFRFEITHILQKIKINLNNTNDLNCINAIVSIFDSIDDLDFLNKRAVFVYIKNLSGLNSKQLSSSLSVIRKHYRNITGKGFNLI